MDAAKKIPALIMVVFLAVYARLTATETPVDRFMDLKETGFGVLEEHTGQEGMAEARITEEDFEALILAFRDRGWAKMDWFKNITLGAGLGLDHIIAESGESGSENEEEVEQKSLLNFHDLEGNEKDYLQAGLGTMVCY